MTTSNENLVKLSMERVEKVFDRMDYNNQINFLWCLDEIKRAGISQHGLYSPMLGRYIKSHPNLDTVVHLDDVYAKSRRMAMKLTELGKKAKLSELMEAAA